MSVEREKATDHDFRILGLSPQASRPEVKKAYREMVRRWHPDHFQQRPAAEKYQAEEKLKEITGAYRRISEGWAGQDRKHPKQRPRRAAAATAATSHSRRAAGSAAAAERPDRGRVSRRGAARVQTSASRQKAVYFFLAFLCLAALVFINLQPVRKALQPAVAMFQPQDDLSRQVSSESSHLRALRAIPAHSAGRKQKIPPAPSPLPPKRTAPASRSGKYFGLGSSQADVLRVEGVPDKISGRTWVYNLSEIHFKNRRVDSYNNFDGSLKVRLLPMHPTVRSPAFFALGSTKNQVLAVMGTPTRIRRQTWYYGFSSIHFKSGRVAAFDNFFGNLKILMLPASAEKFPRTKRFFTIGSTANEVLAAQGTPTRIQGNMWFYQFSNILFRHGKVKYVFDATGNLHFIPPSG